MANCHYCRVSLSPEVQLKNRLCPNCGSDIHCCKNCQHFDETIPTFCKEPESPWVADRTCQNNCPFFEFKLNSKNPPLPKNGEDSEAEKAKEAFRALFRNV
jgi:predicted RNA-binding Zn-ribbon protein involved in translation (DUF1610 family)